MRMVIFGEVQQEASGMATRPRVARDRTSNQDDRESRDTSWTVAGFAPPN